MTEGSFLKLWQLIMRIALGIAILNTLTGLSGKPVSAIELATSVNLLTFIGFIFTFTRFWFGQWKHLEFLSHQERDNPFDGLAFFRNSLLLMQAFTFCYLATCIPSLNQFLIAFVFLLAGNILWLVTGIFHISSLYQGTPFARWKIHIYALCCWTINNSVAVFILLGIVTHDEQLIQAFGISILLLNSYFDYLLTKDFYRVRVQS